MADNDNRRRRGRAFATVVVTSCWQGYAGIRGAALSKGEALQYCNEGYRAEGDSVAFGCFCAGRKFA
jgi:hypothetical protein